MTDGENMTTGAQNGLKALCNSERAQSSSELSFLKIWCVGHRVELAWKSLRKAVLEFDKILRCIITD